VPEVVHPGPAPAGRGGDAGQDHEPGEGFGHAALPCPLPGAGDEQRRRGRVRAEPVTPGAVPVEHGRGGGMQRHQARLVVLAGHGEHGGVRAGVAAVQGQGLADAQPGGRDQADQGLQGG
jgi:hypothetical protein